MPKQKLEIECPVCDAKISIDARSCPKCGADLGMADFQDLERLANDISGGTTTFEPVTVKETVEEKDSDIDPIVEEVPAPAKEVRSPEPEKKTPVAEPVHVASKEEEKDDDESAGDGKKKGLFSKFFGKKK